MTGAATMTATHAGTKIERRDPSPSPGVKPASSGSSDEVEPWDEPPSKTNTREQQEPSSNPLGAMVKSALNFVGAGGEDEGLEDGDLPTLSLKKKQHVSGKYVSGERTTRPLNPPSINGMDEVKDNDPPMRRTRALTPKTAKQAAAQRQFWSQLNPSSPFESDLSRDNTRDREDADEGPDDEMAAVSAARRASRARELDNVPKQGDETIEGDEEHYGGNVARVNSYDENGATCIEYTLASIGNMCGTRQPSSPIKNQERPTKIREVRNIREDVVTDNAEEHTAIEVEYVDPGPIAPRSPPAAAPLSKKEKKKLEKAQAASAEPRKGLPTRQAFDGESIELEESETSAWSSSRKNAVLAAMARRAKEDFQKHEDQKSKQGSMPLTPKRDEAPVGDQDNTSDIYNSFSPSEKRKFLKLINLGLTPSESTARVVEERQDKEITKTPGSSSKKRFPFWKKSTKVDAARSPASPRSDTVARDAPSVSSTAAVGEAEEGAIHLAEPASGESGSPLAEVDAAAAKSKAYSPRATDSSAISASDETPDDECESVEGIGSSSMATPESADSEEPEKDRSAKVAAGVIAAGAVAGVGAVAAHQATVETRKANYEEDGDESSEEEEDSVRGKFPRSGVNYYDGIRKEHPEEEDSDEEYAEELHSPSGKTPTKGSRLASLAGSRTPKSQGFNSLHESDRNLSDTESDAPVTKVALKTPLSPLSPIGGRQSKSSNKDRSGPLSPGGGSASARRRYLGIPMIAGKGFTPLEEDDDSALTNGIREAVATENESKLPERVQTAVAAAAVATAVSAAANSQKSHVPEVADSQSEERPLRSMDDPFFGLDTGSAEAAKQSSDQGTDKDDTIHEEAKDQLPNADVSLDSYLDSATIQSYGGSHDQHSVVTGSVLSGGSGYTAGTGMTGHTQSSRKRRPGAAKDRIAKAKKADMTSPAARGWHESIRAAAATNNRVWDPKRGWIDYKDPNENVQKDTSEERLHISLDGVAMRSPRASDKTDQSQHDGESRSPSVSVPFPPGWEKERNEMLSAGQKEESVPQQAPVSRSAPPLCPRSVTDSDQPQLGPVQPSDQVGSPTSYSLAADTVSPKSRGWVGSMPRNASETGRDVEADSAESDEDHDEETDEKDATSPNKIFAALTKPPSESKIKDAHEFAEAGSRAAAPRPRVAKSSTAVASVDRSEPSGEASIDAVVAGVGEKYVQLGDSGAVKSVRRDSRTKKEEKTPFHPSSLRKASASKAVRPAYDDKAPLLTGGPDDSTEERAPATMVVKEKVDADEFSLFTANDGGSLDRGHGDGTPSRRRGTGPVDVDEVDDLSTETESENGDGEGDTWEPDSYLRGNVSPGMFVKPRNERSADPRFSAPVSSTKTPPKLQKSRRDTSPIRSVGPGDDVLLSPTQVISPDASPRVAMSSPDASPAREETSRTIEQTVSIGDDSVGSSSVKQLAQKWEIRARHGTEIAHNQSGDSFEYDERQITALGDFGPSSNEHDDWSGHYEKPSPAGKREWKSFLGKKVQAESAAATMEETKRSAGASKPGIPRAPGPVKKISGVDKGVHDDQGDSSFSFGDGPSDGDGSPALSAKSAAARRRERALQQNSSPSGFSDVSPIPAQDDFGVDSVRMEMQSDTGTAVEQSSFMRRLSACAAPLSRAFTQTTTGEGVPNSHLDFMRTNPAGQASCGTGAGRFVPAGVCGRAQDIIKDEESDEEDDSRGSYDHEQEQSSAPTSPTSQILREVKQRSSSRGKSRALNDPISDMRSSSSVTSDDFGARTSYLEAIALRSAVSSTSSKKKKSRRRTQDRDTHSAVSDATSDSKQSHSERWQAFLERKASKTASPPGSHASTDISRAAERYASEKMEEMMDAMASRSKSTPKDWRSDDHDRTVDTSYGDSSTASPLSPYRMSPDGDNSSKKTKKKSESAKAAEELAAARVEAMMAAMTSSNLDEGEI